MFVLSFGNTDPAKGSIPGCVLRAHKPQGNWSFDMCVEPIPQLARSRVVRVDGQSRKDVRKGLVGL